MQALYCHTLNADGTLSMRTVEADYEPAANELIAKGEPASDAVLQARWPSYATAVLDALKAQLKDGVDAAAERLRVRLVTPGAGQAMEYQEAQAQAFAALASPATATAALYPMLAATVGLDIDPETKAPAADVVGVARAVQASYDAWLQIGSAIRGVRLKGKASIEAAANAEAALAAAAAIVWPSAA